MYSDSGKYDLRGPGADHGLDRMSNVPFGFEQEHLLGAEETPFLL